MRVTRVANRIKTLGPIAVLPRMDSQNHVLRYLQQRGRGEQIDMLRPIDVLNQSKFNAHNYKVCVFLGEEKFLRSVNETGDAERALQNYLSSGGVLVVLSTNAEPFSVDEKGSATTAVNSLGLSLLGKGETRPNAAGFDEPATGRQLAFRVERDAFGVGLPAQVKFPEDGDRRWRPMVQQREADVFETWIGLMDADGHDLGTGAGWLTSGSPGKTTARVAYASALLTQASAERDHVLDLVFCNVAAHLDPSPAGSTGDAVVPAGSMKIDRVATPSAATPSAATSTDASAVER